MRIDHSRAYHALAVDEHRQTFAPTLWKKIPIDEVSGPAPRSIDDVEQRWFVGAHADVGGGYNNGLLSQRPLQWLAGKASLHGLEFKPFDADGIEGTTPIHDSFGQMLGGLYKMSKLGRPYYRNIGASPVGGGKQTTVTINETIDLSVFDRWQRDISYRPKNLMNWAESARINPQDVRSSVRTDDASVVRDA